MSRIIIAAVLFLLMLLTEGETTVALPANRKILGETFNHIGAEAGRSERKANQVAAPATESSTTAATVAASDSGDIDVKNHHNIPRESWDSGQNQNGPAADDVQSNGGEGDSVNNHA